MAWMLIPALLAPSISTVGMMAKAASGGNLCEHHPEHTSECGYEETGAGSPCSHVHDAACGYSEPTGETECTHVHDDVCGYQEAVEEVPCDMGCEATDGEGNIVHQEGCAYTPAKEGAPCGHIHDENCGYGEPTEGSECRHVHDENCGYQEGGGSCNYVCEFCVTDWEWDDGEGVLVWNEEAGLWGLGVPGANELNPVTPAFLDEMLPKAITAETAAGSGTVDLTWDYGEFPEEGSYEGSYVLTAKLDGEYVLTEEAPDLEVLLEIGGGGMYDFKRKFLNKWYFICRDGKEITNEKGTEAEISAAIAELDKKTPAEILKWLEESVLPLEIGGWVSNDPPNDPRLGNLGWKENTKKKDLFYEVTVDGDKLYPTGAQWGSAPIDGWKFADPAPTSFQDKDTVIVQAYTVSKNANGSSYQLFVNSNNPDDHKADSAGKDTQTNFAILSLKVTLYDINLADHVVPAANPENVKVNLFDYWVKTENPTAPAGDILDKNDSHLHEEGGEGVLGTLSAPYSTKEDWNRGINQGHLLLFGDGLIHAGLWNKGAGENCRYGKTYAGMEEIVKKVLPESGYPEINLSKADKILTDGSPARDYTLIKDYKLSGDHNTNTEKDQYGNPQNAYDSDNIQNLSKTVIGTWGKDINTATESLQYLFDPNDSTNSSKKSYRDVKGLFQLDEKGYYYYNMRENFAEFSEADGNHFILYDAPATIRTDGDQSVGNFFPFNKGSEVFNGVDADKNLTSTVACSGNAMNHHLGMTVDVEFRQPANGRVRVGSSNEPMTFEFAGDDDVWVFIDDVLVLDLGGIHSELYGTIDFADGDVYIGRAFDSKGIPDDPENPSHMVTHTTLRDLYRAAGREGDIQWKGDTFASNTSHTLKMFYLERGNYDSSIALRFNLQPLLHQQIMKVDQNGKPLSDVEFELHPAEVTDDTDAIRCFYTDGNQNGETFYVRPDDTKTLVTLTTKPDGSAVFLTPDGSYFNFADRGDQYYVLRETTAPNGYRMQPIDIVLHYDTGTSMLSVANRWTTGAYACSVSNITGVGTLKYGELHGGAVQPGNEAVPASKQEEGLVVAVPMLQKQSDHSWLALYGSNMGGFRSVPIAGDGESAWQNAVLQAALEQAHAGNTSDWHLEWDADNGRLYGRLSDLPGLASRYQINNPNGDMSMVYGIISKEALDDLGITGANHEERYGKLREYLQNYSPGEVLNAIQGTTDGFRFLSVAQFNREFRSLIYIPNERRELWVMKVDQDGNPLEDTEFGLYSDAACTTQVSFGTTNAEGMLIFSPNGNNSKGSAQMSWTSSTNTQYYLKEKTAPSGYNLNPAVVPVIVGTYSIYADAGIPENGVSVMAGVGRLTQTMRQFAMAGDVDITLQDITAFMQTQKSGAFQLTGWQDAKLEDTNIVRNMNLHFGINAQVDYGLHDEDGGKLYKPFFVTNEGFIRARVQQNYAALVSGMYEGVNQDANKDDLGDTDLTNLFSLLNMVVVTDRSDSEIRTGRLTIGKKLTGSGLTDSDYTKNFAFAVEFKDADGNSLAGKYYFYGDNKAGYIASGENLILHHDEAVTILGLPEGTKYTVTEKPETGWHVTPGTGVYTGEIRKDETIELRYTNSKDPKKPEEPDNPKDPPGDTPDGHDSPGGDLPKDTPAFPEDIGGPEPFGGIFTGGLNTGDGALAVFWIMTGCLLLVVLSRIYFCMRRRGR